MTKSSLAAILIGALLAAAVLFAPRMAPYRLIANAGGFWQLNIATGEVRLCLFDINEQPGHKFSCTVAYQPADHGPEKPTADQLLGPAH